MRPYKFYKGINRWIFGGKMCNKFDISVIIPVYNVEKYVYETIKSVVNQNFSKYEIIIINDGSKDKSLKIIEEYLSKENVEYTIINQTNQGLSAARNRGIKEAKGNYICFIDSDDIIQSSHLYTLFTLAENNRLQVVHSNFEMTRENNREGSIIEDYQEKVFSKYETIEYAIRRKPAVLVCGFLLKRDFVIEKNLWFNEKLRFGEDSDYIWRVLFECEKVGFTNKSTYKYLQRDNSIMRSISNSQMECFIEEFSRTIKNIEKRNRTEKKLAKTVYYRVIIGALHSYSRCADKEKFRSILNKINRKELCIYLRKFPDIRIKILSILLRVAPICFYKMFNKR